MEMTFIEFFKNSQNYNDNNGEKYIVIHESEGSTESDFDDVLNLLRKNGYKIKTVTYTKFGLQIDLAKKYNLEEIEKLLKDYNIKIKDNSIFIEF